VETNGTQQQDRDNILNHAKWRSLLRSPGTFGTDNVSSNSIHRVHR